VIKLYEQIYPFLQENHLSKELEEELARDDENENEDDKDAPQGCWMSFTKIVSSKAINDSISR